MALRIVITGSGDAFSERHFGSSAVAVAPEGLVMIDCPDPIHRVLREASAISGIALDPASIHDVVITHLHGDHANGLEAFAFTHWLLRRQDTSRRKPRLHAAAPVMERMWSRLAPSMDQGGTVTIEEYFEPRILVPGTAAWVAGMQVDCRITTHMIPTIGLRLRHGAVGIGWSGDTGFEPAHVDWLCECGVVVHETSPPPFHTPVADLLALPERIRRKIRLIHAPDDFDPASCPLPLVQEGDVIEAS
ncbi:MAG: MBL fold metallo-hydrolase [Phycisphaerales bacterium]|nr:MBL fold metallo-hydrolase [Phycisphaerales bacterium]